MARLPKILGCCISAIIAVSLVRWVWLEHIRWGNWQVTALHAFPIIILGGIAIAGSILIGAGWPIRHGNQLHCSTCGHEYSFDECSLLNYCQECGAAWRWFGGCKVGRRIAKPALLNIGIGLIALLLAAWITDSMDATLLRPPKPKWAMLKTVQGAGVIDALADYRALRIRMSKEPGLTGELATAIMDRRNRGLPMPSEFTNWMHGNIVTNVLPQSLVDRWFGEMFQMRIDMPAVVRVGDRPAVSIAGLFTGGWEGVADVPQVVFGGVTFDAPAGPTPNRSADPQLRQMYTSQADSMWTWRTLAQGEIDVPTRPQHVKAIFTAWLIIGQPTNSIDFGPDGRPIAPAADVIREFRWSQMVDVLDAIPAVKKEPPRPPPRPTPPPSKAKPANKPLPSLKPDAPIPTEDSGEPAAPAGRDPISNPTANPPAEPRSTLLPLWQSSSSSMVIT